MGQGELLMVLAEMERQLGCFLALLLTAAALHKAFTPRTSLAATAALARSRLPLARVLLPAAALTELVAAGLLLSAEHVGAGALLAAALLGGYLAALARALGGSASAAIDCGCHFGSPSHERPALARADLARNALLIGLALLLALLATRLAAAGAGPIPLEAHHLLAGAGGLALYLAFDALRGLPPLSHPA
jgi:hypothetical protein